MKRQPAVGIFVIRAWYEDNELRARVTLSVDVGADPTTHLATADPDELMTHLDAWLTELAARAPGRGGASRG